MPKRRNTTTLTQAYPDNLTTINKMPHTPISPAILYFGTPVALLSTQNPDSTSNLAPMSSIFWLAHRCVLGYG